MDDKQFNTWVEVLGLRIGVRASVLRKIFLTNALDERLRENHIEDYDTYYEFLHCGNKGELEWAKLIDLLTVNDTWFFRHESSLDALKEFAENKISHFSEDSCQNASQVNTIQAWSVGCATGEEAYTIAMILDRVVKQSGANACYSVFASDVSHGALLCAQKGLYAASQLKNIDQTFVNEYFIEDDNGKYQIIDELKKRVCFTETNVLDLQHVNIGQVDVIFCQNLLIYFEHAARIEILNNLIQYLAPNGLLILGAGEVYHWVNSQMKLISTENILAYRKSGTKISGILQ